MLDRGRMGAGLLPRALFGVGIALVLATARSGAAADAEPIALEFHTSAECGSGAAFEAQVLARTARARIIHAAGAAALPSGRVFRVTIDGKSPDPVTGRAANGSATLIVVDAHGRTSERKLGAAPCAELVEALALVTAIAIDPAASTKPIAELAPAPPPLLGFPRDAAGPTSIPIPPPPVPTRDKPSAPKSPIRHRSHGGFPCSAWVRARGWDSSDLRRARGASHRRSRARKVLHRPRSDRVRGQRLGIRRGVVGRSTLSVIAALTTADERSRMDWTNR